MNIIYNNTTPELQLEKYINIIKISKLKIIKHFLDNNRHKAGNVNYILYFFKIHN